MQVLIDKVEFEALKKLVGGISSVKTKLRFIKFDFDAKQVVATDGLILVVLSDRLPNDTARKELGVKEDLLIPLSQLKGFDGLGRVEIKTLYYLSETNPDTGKVMKKPVPVLTAYNLNGTDYVEMFDFVSGENDYINYEEMLDNSTKSTQNALFVEEIPEYGVTRFLPRMEDGLRKLDDKANIKLTKEFIVSEGFLDHRNYRVIAKTPAKHDVGSLGN